MILKSITYEEYNNQPEHWKLELFDFRPINLVVGQNSAGKTRLLNVTIGLAKLLSGKSKMFRSAQYDAVFQMGADEYHYQLSINEGNVTFEELKINSIVKLSRTSNPKIHDVIFAEQLNDNMQFNTPPNGLAAFLKRDSIQHPFLEQLFDWAVSTKHYLFGSPFGKDHFMALNEDNDNQLVPDDPNLIVQAFLAASKTHGDDFKQQILEDFEKLGYPCTDLMVDRERGIGSNQPINIYSLSVKEADLSSSTSQLQMSQGMYRALALLIHLNIGIFSKKISTLLVDDIGEGLDYQRSSAIIKLLIDKAENERFQLIMTTNDRFVMNSTDLDYWSVLVRNKNFVSVVNEKNSPDIFEEFKYTGLSNFDFFQKKLFSTSY